MRACTQWSGLSHRSGRRTWTPHREIDATWGEPGRRRMPGVAVEAVAVEAVAAVVKAAVVATAARILQQPSGTYR